MEKTPVAFVGLVFLYVLFSLGGLACLRSPVFYGCGLLTLGPPVALILYTSHHSVFRFVDGIGLKHIFSKEILSIFTAEGQQFFWEALPSRFGWGAVILGCVGLFFAVRRKLHFYGVWALAFALECVHHCGSDSLPLLSGVPAAAVRRPLCGGGPVFGAPPPSPGGGGLRGGGR